MRVPCYNCDIVTELEVGFEVVNFVCPNCHSLYLSDSERQLRLKSQFKPEVNYFSFKIGDKGVLKGIEYTVTGAIVKKVSRSYIWTEYILKNSKGDFVYLSESDGNWIFLTEMKDTFDIKKHPKVIRYNNSNFDLYEYCDVEIENVQGFFDFALPSRKIHMVEYIQPPLMISIERINDNETAFLGEYITKSEIRRGFPNVNLPYQIGVNITEPFYFELTNTAIIFCVFALMIVFSNWYIYMDQAEQTVFNKTIAFTDFDNKEFTSESFSVKGGSAPMTIHVSTDVNNSWANVDVALVDEKNNEEIHANKDIEFYHGYESGESWTEGSPFENFNICGVKEGKYHLLITPAKAPEDVNNNMMSIRVVWDEPSNRNAWLTIIFMIAVFVLIRFLKVNFEKKRWADSSYSPYNE